MVSPHAARSHRTTFSTSNGGHVFPFAKCRAAVSSVDRPRKKSLAELSDRLSRAELWGGIILIRQRGRKGTGMKYHMLITLENQFGSFDRKISPLMRTAAVIFRGIQILYTNPVYRKDIMDLIILM